METNSPIMLAGLLANPEYAHLPVYDLARRAVNATVELRKRIEDAKENGNWLVKDDW